MKYLSVCSGIEAATVAWRPLGWESVAFAEIEKFPSAVLAHHYPTVPNWGDLTKFQEWPDATFDLLVGGTPCQSFSIAGARKGLDDPRGALTFAFLATAARYAPAWVVWENVPGVLSSNGGRDFGAFLGALAQLGYGFAYRVLDAQYFGLAQRRKRVFVVGHLGDWRRAAAVLFERESLSGHPAPRREAGQGATPILEAGARTGRSTDDPRAGIGIGEPGDPMYTLQAGKHHAVAPTIPARTRGGGGLGADFDCDGGLIADVCGALNSAGGHAYPGQTLQDAPAGMLIAGTGDISHCLNAGGMGRIDYESETLIARGEGFDASEDGTGRGTPIVPVAFDARQSDVLQYGERTSPLDTDGHSMAVHVRAQVRRLTTLECCRLQGFPDTYLDIEYRGKPAADGPKYKALGNSMAVPVVRWIGRRIAFVSKIRGRIEP